MAERKPISKRTRFEVFKRDGFKCNYCGRSAPDVILEVDHLDPIHNDGTNDLFNLTTSCFDCNRGKSKIKLSDTSLVEKQRVQIQELNLRQEQLKMMLEWRTGVIDLASKSVDEISAYIDKKLLPYNVNVTQKFKNSLSTLIKKYGESECLDAFDECFDRYIQKGVGEVLSKYQGYLAYRNSSESDKTKMVIFGVCRNRFRYYNPKKVRIAIEKLQSFGIKLDDILAAVKEMSSFNELLNWSESITE